MPEPNRSLRAAREATPSRREPAGFMSRDECAELVALWLADRDSTGRTYAFDANHLGKIERGAVRRPSACIRAALSAVLNAPETALGFGESATMSSTLDRRDAPWSRLSVAAGLGASTGEDVAATRRQALAAATLAGLSLTDPLQRWLNPLGEGTSSRLGGAFSRDEVESWETLADQIKSWGVGGRKAAIAALSDLGERLHDAPSGPLTDRAAVAAARLAKTTASWSWDIDAQRSAQRYYIHAAQLAKLGGDDTLAAVALAGLARQCFYLDRPADGLDIVQLAQYGTRQTATPRLRSLLATREAWAHARRGDIQPFRRATSLALDHFAEAGTTNSTRWVESFDAAELHGTIGGRFRDLAEHDPSQARHAQTHIQQALRLRNPGLTRNRVFDLVGLARAHLISSDAEHACHLIDHALPLAKSLASGRVRAELDGFYRDAAPYASVAVVRDTRDAIRELATA